LIQDDFPGAGHLNRKTDLSSNLRLFPPAPPNQQLNAPIIGFLKRGDPGLMWGNTGTLRGLCNKISALVVVEMWGLRFLNALLSGRMLGLHFCSTERSWERLIATSIYGKMEEEKKNRR